MSWYIHKNFNLFIRYQSNVTWRIAVKSCEIILETYLLFLWDTQYALNFVDLRNKYYIKYNKTFASINGRIRILRAYFYTNYFIIYKEDYTTINKSRNLLFKWDVNTRSLTSFFTKECVCSRNFTSSYVLRVNLSKQNFIHQ